MYGYNQFNPYQQQYNPRNELLFVNGVESARMYQMPPNSKQILMDRDSSRFYLVETDAAGLKNVRTFSFTEEREERSEYVTREEFERWKETYEPFARQATAAQPSGVLADGFSAASGSGSEADALGGAHLAGRIPEQAERGI